MPRGKGRPAVAPWDVRVEGGKRARVQREVMILCGRETIKPERAYGAPDFVLEVLSPSTRRKDEYLKTYKYCSAGVREYWMIDPEKRRIVVHDFEDNDQICIYGFEDVVPIRIWDGACKIDFKDMLEFLEG